MKELTYKQSTTNSSVSSRTSTSSPTSMNYKLRRVVPYISVLMNSPNPKKQTSLLKTFPDFVLDDIAEVLYNVMRNNVKLRSGKQRQLLGKHKNQLTLLFNNSKKKKVRRSIVRKQKGGFVGAVLPVVASVLASALL